jgi:hypothetical protein
VTNDEMQTAMEFIVEQQAQSSERIDALAETQRRAEERWNCTEEGIRGLLIIAEVREREIQANTEQILSLGRTTRATDDPLNALINVVERQLSNGRNGKQ